MVNQLQQMQSVVDGLPVGALGRVEEQGRVPSAENGGALRPAALERFEGRTAYYRLVLAGSEIAGWRDPLSIGKVQLFPSLRPVSVQRTYVAQVAGRAALDKITYRYDVGHGRWLTVALRPMRIALNTIVSDMQGARRESLAAVGVVAALLDERFAIEELGENIVVMNETGTAQRDSLTSRGALGRTMRTCR